ncbi:MAG TPA: hypothetical protein VKW78_12470 [Terriglobales bacterium]|nr:hypothetical protein [Terriglobales bacterium]
MTYRFSLATLLRFRESLEQRRWLELQHANQQVQKTMLAIAELESKRKEWRRQRQQALATSVVALAIEPWAEQYYERRAEELARQLTQARKVAVERLAAFQRARQAREIVTNLYLRDRAAYQDQRAKREQAQVDEMFLMRREHLAKAR